MVDLSWLGGSAFAPFPNRGRVVYQVYILACNLTTLMHDTIPPARRIRCDCGKGHSQLDHC